MNHDEKGVLSEYKESPHSGAAQGFGQASPEPTPAEQRDTLATSSMAGVNQGSASPAQTDAPDVLARDGYQRWVRTGPSPDARTEDSPLNELPESVSAMDRYREKANRGDFGGDM